MKANNEQKSENRSGQPSGKGEAKSQQANDPGAKAKGPASNSKEPTLRSATTDSSRTHKNPHDDLPTGGNVR